MLRVLCRRYRRCEYYWTIVVIVILVFLYTYLYNVYVGSDPPADTSYVAAVHRGPPRDQDSNEAISTSSRDKATDGSYKKNFSENTSVRTSTASVASSPTTPDNNPQVEGKMIEDKQAVTEEDDPIMKIREQVNKMNKDEIVLNDDKFLSFDLVMIVQVHRRTEYLKMLVESLRNARDISKVLLVVSFDYYDEELFSVVEKIEYCKVMLLSSTTYYLMHVEEVTVDCTVSAQPPNQICMCLGPF